MLDHNNHYFTIFFHYLFYLILVGLLSFSLTYFTNNDQDSEAKGNLEKTASFVLKQAQNSR